VLQTFARECFRYEGRDVERVDLTFTRDAAAGLWGLYFTAWRFGVCP
jgi:hypothetical protein